MTEQQYKELLASCDFNQPKKVSELVTASYTNVLFNNKVLEIQMANPLSPLPFFQGLFGTRVWPDGQGMDEVREYSTDPFVPIDFNHFIRSGRTCDPNLSNGCDVDLCEIPEGGRGTLPPFRFFKWGFRTPRTCIEDIRHIRDFWYWASKVIRNRQIIDDKVMEAFYIMAAINTAGHKITLNGVRDSAGNLTLVPSNNPRNPLGAGSYNYMEDLFPQIINPNDVLPLTYDLLEPLARRWGVYNIGNEIATDASGKKIYELWHPDDLYQEEVLRNPDYMKSLQFTMPSTMFDGYHAVRGDQQVVGNYKIRQMPGLPRFGITANGNIISVNTHDLVNIEVGTEPVPSAAWMNAPFGIAGIVGHKKQGAILTRPTLSQSGEGFPIKPIAGVENWQINNHYDAQCNRFENKPFSYRRYEMGFQMDDPNAGLWFLFRRRVFNMTPISDCNLAPIVVTPERVNDCPITTIGCQDGKRRVSNSITQNDNAPQYVECSAASCGNTASGSYLYRITVDRRTNNPGFNSLKCDCGDPVFVGVYDANGAFVENVEGVIQDTSFGFPYGVYFIELESALSAGQCIKHIQCIDDSPEEANVISCENLSPVGGNNRIRVVLEHALECSDENDAVEIQVLNAQGSAIETWEAKIISYNPLTNIYVLEGTGEDNDAITCYGDVVGGVSMTVTCASE